MVIEEWPSRSCTTLGGSPGVIRNALNLLGVDVFFQMIAIGLVIVIAVEGDVLRNYLESRVRAMQAGRD